MNKPKVIITLFGLPFITLVIGFLVAIMFKTVTMQYSLLCTALILICGYAHKRVLDKNSEYQKLSMDIGSPISMVLYVKGLPDNIHQVIENIITANELVVCQCPKDPMLRDALKQYVYKRGGFCEFKKSKSFTLTGRPLGKRSLLLSYSTKGQLQDAISVLLERNWELYGQQGTEANLISRVYTQTMIYKP